MLCLMYNFRYEENNKIQEPIISYKSKNLYSNHRFIIRVFGLFKHESGNYGFLKWIRYRLFAALQFNSHNYIGANRHFYAFLQIYFEQ